MSTDEPRKARRKGVSLAELFARFPDDAASEAWLEKVRWGDEPYCPHCGSFDVARRDTHPTQPYRCLETKCSKHFSVRTNSVMRKSKLGYRTWVLAIYLLCSSPKGASSLQLERDLGIAQRSAWFLAHRIRAAWATGSQEFEGPVEVDEVYFGGRGKWKHADKRKKQRGRGAVGKTPVVGARDRSTKRVKALVTTSTTTGALTGFIESNVKPDAMVYTDEARMYGNLPHHKAVSHSNGEYVRYEDGHRIHTNGIESFWALMRRGYHGTYHKMSPKHLDRYVAEFSGRYNSRELNTIDQMAALVRGMMGKRLQYDELIAPNDLESGARPAALF